MIELLKLFTEEPQKLTKLIYATLRVLLSLALMSILFEWLSGKNITYDLTNIDY